MKKIIIALSVALVILLLLLAGLTILRHQADMAYVPPTEPPVPPTTQAPPPTTEPPTQPTTAPTEPETEPTEPPTEPEPTIAAACIADTDPANWEMEWTVLQGETELENYIREEPITFEKDSYFALPGVASFRGDMYRQNGAYGTADITEHTINHLWKMNVGGLDGGEWAGCGWTGQPLVVQWDAETRAIMNLYEDKKEKDGLVEAVYAKLDGRVHFIDMEDGSQTRDPVYVGQVFKGSGALDPRGYPILYVGGGLQRGGQMQRIYIVSLIDGSILYEMSGVNNQSPRYWCGLDGGPLVDAETDTLIYPCENGLIYTIKLNTQYDKAAGTLTMAPEEPIASKYKSNYTRGGRYSGYEASVTAADHYLFMGDNSGLLQCIDINTMQIVWAQDLKDDINATPLFDWEDGKGYIYAAPSVDYNRGSISLYKIDAQTGAIIWEKPFECGYDSSIPGGLMGSPVVGKDGTNMEDLIIFAVGRYPSMNKTTVFAYNKRTGEEVWQYETSRNTWSSPIALYTEDGRGYLFQADIGGNCRLVDGATGEVVALYELGRTTESSPVAFGNKILLGTRSAMHLFEIK